MKTRANHSFRWVAVILAAASVQLTTGCASFQGHQIPQVAPEPSQQVENKPTVCLDAKFFYKSGKNRPPMQNIKDRPMLFSYMERIFAESKMFGQISTNITKAEDMDLTIRLNLTNSFSETSAWIKGFIFAMFVGFIPVSGKDTYSLEAVVCDARGTVLKEYRYEDYVRTWFHVVLLPFMGSVKKAPEQVITNMMRFFLHELSRDGILQGDFRKNRIDQKKAEDIARQQPPAPPKTAISSQEKIEVRVIAPQAVIRLHPDPESPVITPVPMGARLDVKEKTGIWYSVTFLKEGMTVEGYILQEYVEVIKK